MLLGLADKYPSFCTNPDPSINRQRSQINLDCYYLRLFDFIFMKTFVNVPSNRNKQN
jgi:hypothetical protein